MVFEPRESTLHDGEGRLWAHWSLFGISSRWMITSARDAATAEADLTGVIALPQRDTGTGGRITAQGAEEGFFIGPRDPALTDRTCGGGESRR